MNLLTPGQLLVGAYAAFAPISWSDGGEPAGHDIVFLRAFAEQHGLAFQVRFFPFDGLWERLGRDECDLAAAGLAPMPSRVYAGVIWSQPYFAGQRALLVRAEDSPIATIADLAGRTIAVTRGSTAEDDVLARKPASARVVSTVDQRQSLEDLAAGVIDAYATGDATAAAIRAAGLRRVGLLGTRFTMEEPFYRRRLAERHGLEVIVPEATDRATVNRVIYEELCLGVIREESRAQYRAVMGRLVAQGAEGIILGCAEITFEIADRCGGAPGSQTLRSLVPHGLQQRVHSADPRPTTAAWQ